MPAQPRLLFLALVYKGGLLNPGTVRIQLLEGMQWFVLFLSVVSLLSPAPSFTFAEVSKFRSVEKNGFSGEVQRKREATQRTCPRYLTSYSWKACSYCKKVETEYYKYEELILYATNNLPYYPEFCCLPVFPEV